MNYLHANGKKEYIKGLRLQKQEEIDKIHQRLISQELELSMIEEVKLKFKKLFVESDHALYLMKESNLNKSHQC